MIPGVGAQVLPSLVEGGAGTAAIAQHAFDDFAQVPARVDCEDVVGHVLADVGDDERNAVQNGKLPQALVVGAMENAFDYMAVVLANHLGNAQGRGTTRRAADGADRP